MELLFIVDQRINGNAVASNSTIRKSEREQYQREKEREKKREKEKAMEDSNYARKHTEKVCRGAAAVSCDRDEAANRLAAK